MAKAGIFVSVVGSADLKAFGQARSELDKLEAQVKSTTEKTGGHFASLGNIVKGAGLAAAGAGIIEFAKGSADAFKEAQASQARLTDAFTRFPALADVNIKSLRDLNTNLQKKTVFDDDAVASGQAVLASFKLTGSQLKEVTPLLLDYAAKTGKDLPTAATDLGKAILGQGRSLKAIGVNFHDAGSAAGNFSELTGVLRDKVGGFAEHEGKTAAGQSAILKNQFGELQEKVGSFLVPALQKLANIVLTIITFFQNLSPGVQIAIGVIAGLLAGVLVVSKAIQAWTKIQAAFNVIMDANPLVLVALAIAALVVGVILAYQHFQVFRDTVDAVFGFVKTVVGGTINWLKSNWDLVLGILLGPFGLILVEVRRHWDDILGFLKSLPGKIASAASGMWDGIKDAFRAAVNWIIRGWNNLEFKMPSVDTHIPGVGKIGGFTLGLPDIPLLAAGGTALGGGLAVVGERGRELVDLPAGADVMRFTGHRELPGMGVTVAAGAVTVHLEVHGNADDTIPAKVRAVVDDAFRSLLVDLRSR